MKLLIGQWAFFLQLSVHFVKFCIVPLSTVLTLRTKPFVASSLVFQSVWGLYHVQPVPTSLVIIVQDPLFITLHNTIHYSSLWWWTNRLLHISFAAVCDGSVSSCVTQLGSIHCFFQASFRGRFGPRRCSTTSPKESACAVAHAAKFVAYPTTSGPK